MICHRHLADRLSFIDLSAVSLSLFLVDCRIKSTGTLTHLKTSFEPALELNRSPRPRVFCQQSQKKRRNRMREIDSKKIFQEVGALAKSPPKSTCNVSFHRNFIRFRKLQSFESNGQIENFPI